MYLNRTIDIRVLRIILASSSKKFQSFPGFTFRILPIADKHVIVSPADVVARNDLFMRKYQAIREAAGESGINSRLIATADSRERRLASVGLSRARHGFGLILIQFVVQCLKGDSQLRSRLRFVAPVS